MAREKDKCPAVNVKCHRCGQLGHFKICCRKRGREAETHPTSERARYDQDTTKCADKGVNRVTNLNEVNERLILEIGGVKVKMLIDSGSSANILTSQTFERLKHYNAKLVNERTPASNSMVGLTIGTG